MSLKLFRLSLGSTEHFAVAANKEEMHENRATLEAAFAYTPVVIEEVTVPGFEIVVYPAGTALNGIDEEPFEDAASLGLEVPQPLPDEEETEAEEPKELTPEEEAAHAILELPFDIETATKAEMTEYLKSKNIGVKSNATVSYLQELVINSLV